MPAAAPGGPAPLLRPRTLRTLVALALTLVSLLLLPLSLVLALWWMQPWTVAVGLLPLLVLTFAVRPVDLGRWSADWRRGPEVAAFSLVVGLGAIASVYALVRALDALNVRDALGTPPEDIAFWFVCTIPGLAGAALLLACVPLPFARRHARLLVSGVAATAAGGTLAAFAVHVGPDGCDGFRPDRTSWLADIRHGGTDDSERVAAAIVRCGTVDGASRAQVAQVLGPDQRDDPFAAPSQWSWQIGWTGSGDGRYLELYFEDGRVRESSISPTEQAD